MLVPFGVAWGALGGLLLAFWGPLGCFRCLLGAPWCLQVVFWCPSGVLWGALGVSWGPLGAPRWSFGRLVGGFLAPLVWPGAFFGGPRGFSRILVAFPRAGQRPSTKKRAVETQAGHTHTHATSFTKPRFPFHDSQVSFWGVFGRFLLVFTAFSQGRPEKIQGSS